MIFLPLLYDMIMISVSFKRASDGKANSYDIKMLIVIPKGERGGGGWQRMRSR